MRSLKSRLPALICALMLAFAAFPVSSAQISPSFEIIARNLFMSKSAVAGTEITFTAEDFDLTFGAKQKSITISSIPDKSIGRLIVGSTEAAIGQTVKRSSFGKIKFVPTSIIESESSFALTGDSNHSYNVVCSLYLLPTLNSAPTTKLVNDKFFNVNALSNVSYYGSMRAVDPENDLLRYEVISPPKKGTISVTDPNHGGYKYTPITDFSGKDSFEYIVFDKYGNRSTKTTVKINVERPAKQIFYADLNDHWAQTSAIKLYNEDIMRGFIVDGIYVFRPNDNISRAEFLTIAMMAAGYTVKGNSVSTHFIDNAAIPDEYRGYVAAALKLGFISGAQSNGGYVFNPNSAITRAEAAVMIDNIIGLPDPAIRAVFADNDSVPAWAADAIYALNETGILTGMSDGYMSPHAELTRAQSAKIICGVLEL